MGSIPITRSILLVRDEGANARNTFLLLHLRGRITAGFEAGLRAVERHVEAKKSQAENLSVVGPGRFSAILAVERAVLDAQDAAHGRRSCDIQTDRLSIGTPTLRQRGWLC